jgi:hypothetical protein
VVLNQLVPSTRSEIASAIKKLCSSKSSPDDIIPTALLKLDEDFPSLMSHICNESFASATFPINLKCGIITPVLKKRGLDQSVPSNYRPISNLKVIAKLIEGIAASRLNKHLELVGYLHPLQSAYRRGFSTETATLYVSSQWRSALDDGKLVLIASLDVTAAFDTVNHQIILGRLFQAGVLGKAYSWFDSYLSSRSAVVKYGQARSSVLQLTCGVPQGSVLGPCLFNVYMADLCRMIENEGDDICFHVYADDVLLYIASRPDDLAGAVGRLQAIVNKVEKWMHLNHLLLSPDKTGLFLFHRKQAKIPGDIPSMSIGGKVIKFNASAPLKWLGVHFDPILDMSIQVNRTCQTCYLLLRMLRQIRPTLDRKSCLLLANALICSRIDYCNSLLFVMKGDLSMKLQRVMNLAARIVTKSRRVDHVTPLLKELGWPRIAARIVAKIALLTFKTIRQKSPHYLLAAITIYQPNRSLRSASQTTFNLVLGSANSSIGRGMWNVTAPQVWNSLPASIRVQGIKYDTFHQGLLSFLSSDV